MIDVRSYNKDSTPYTFYSQAALFVVQPVPYTKLIPYQNTKLFTEPNGNQPSHQKHKTAKRKFFTTMAAAEEKRGYDLDFFQYQSLMEKTKQIFKNGLGTFYTHVYTVTEACTKNYHKEVQEL